MSNGTDLAAIREKLQQIQDQVSSIRNMMFLVFLLALAVGVEVFVGWERLL